MKHKDHRLEVYLDAAHYLALMARAESEDRTVSQHVRHLIRLDLEASVEAALAREKGNGGGSEGEVAV